MLSQQVIGQYVPGNSIMHRLDPRAKIIAACLLALEGMLAVRWPEFVLTALPVLLGLLLAKLPLRLYWRGMRWLWIIFTITAVLQAFTIPGRPLWSFGAFAITVEGLVSAGELLFRLVVLMLTAMLLTMTTSPINLNVGIERLLTPLARVGVPAHELAMMITIALRFVPTLFEEAETVIKAQQARGSSLYGGQLATRIKAVVPLMVPLLAGALRRAEELATAMEARCYRIGANRTRMNALKMSAKDYGIIVVLSISFLVLVLLRTWK